MVVGIIIGVKFIPYLGFFPYKEELNNLWPAVLRPLASFDGIHYILIAKRGYMQYEQAFFPLYPNLIQSMGKLWLFNGVFISVFSFIFGLFVWSKYLKILKLNEKNILWYWIIFPTAFYFGTVYTESLFFLLAGLTLLFAAKNKYLWAIIAGILAAQTRIIGLALVIPIFWQNRKKWWMALGPIIGFLSYCFYLWKTTGDPLMFYHSQSMFGANRVSGKIILLPQVMWRYFKIFIYASHDFKYFIAILEFAVLILCLYLLIKQLLRKRTKLLGLNLFSWIVIILPTLTGTLSSLPRYVLMAPAIFIELGEKDNKIIKYIFGILFVLLLGFFVRGYFVS